MRPALQLPQEASQEARPYQVCTRCIMDTSDATIRFDDDGVCHHCHRYAELADQLVRHDAAGQREMDQIVETIKQHGKDKAYDCAIGVSGGVDSTYAAYVTRQLGLRPLAIHMDNGWDSELAVSNIEKVLKHLEIDLYTHVLDWEEFKDLQLSFLKASVSDAEIPTDHAIAAVIYRVAAEKGLSYIISGGNVVTEAILPATWTYGILDWRYIKAVHRQFGRVRLRRFPHVSLRDWFYFSAVKKMQTIRLLNYLPYSKKEAMRVLQGELGWRYYGGKHYESIYTRFFQGYILPRKFNMDKRRPHLSTLICSGELTRAEALEEMRHNPYTEQMQHEDREYVIKKLGLTEMQFDEIMARPLRTHDDYPNSEQWLRMLRQAYRAAKRLIPMPRIDSPL